MQKEFSPRRIFRWYFHEDRWLRRGLALAIALFLLSAVANVYMQLSERGREVAVVHTERLARLILAQAQHEAQIWFLQDNLTGLESLARHLQQQTEILEVAIQDQYGQTLVRIGHDLPVYEYLQSLPQVIWAKPMVEPVLDRDGPGAQLLGFVRITFDYDRIMAESRSFNRSIMSENAYVMLLAFFAGIMVAAAFIRRRKPAVIRGLKEQSPDL
ncbi:AhpA/YtjB family protein [Aliidiomarina celeris]|uniref:AhpA/YtjB family protein n=1 Tax=Aliidiomarina celeris TaxID=2249428 RepID=UPI000DE96502|nr:AhpA/YtjB family protein [Aliidiomarina celeris]